MKGAIRTELEYDMLFLSISVQRVHNLMNTVGLHDTAHPTELLNDLELFLKIHGEPLILINLSCFTNYLYSLCAASIFQVRHHHLSPVDFVLSALIVEPGDLYFFRTNIL